jgi:hypothetical protein
MAGISKERKLLNPFSFIMFCNVVDCDMFVSMSTLKSPITTVGQSMGIFFKIVLKSEMK